MNYKIISLFFVSLMIFSISISSAQTNTTRIIIKPNSINDEQIIIHAVESNYGKYIRQTLDGVLIFNVPSKVFDKLKSLESITQHSKYIQKDVLTKLEPSKAIVIENPPKHTQLIPNDPYYSQLWGMPMIDAERMWNNHTGAGITVAVVDSGVDYNHEDLAAVDPSLGWDFVNADSNPMDDNGHGTHVAGTIAATMNNGIGVAGVAPGVTIMPVKVCDNRGFCWDTDISDGIRWATDHGANIISMSIGGSTPSTLTKSATKYAFDNGVLIIAAAGNDGTNKPSYPAAYPWVVSVGAIDYSGKKAWYSQYGSFLNIMAPGGSSDGIYSHGIISTYPGNKYASMSGTSMATPHVSGVAALYWSDNLNYTNKQVGKYLMRFADDLGTPGRDDLYGYGIVDAFPWKD